MTGPPFTEADLVSSYTVEQAIEDGVFVQVGDSGKLRVTSSLAAKLLGEDHVGLGALRMAISGMVGEYVAGAYCVPRRASDYPEECDAGLAAYLYDVERRCVASDGEPRPGEVRVWACGDGAGGLTLMLPEVY